MSSTFRINAVGLHLTLCKAKPLPDISLINEQLFFLNGTQVSSSADLDLSLVAIRYTTAYIKYGSHH